MGILHSWRSCFGKCTVAVDSTHCHVHVRAPWHFLSSGWLLPMACLLGSQGCERTEHIAALAAAAEAAFAKATLAAAALAAAAALSGTPGYGHIVSLSHYQTNAMMRLRWGTLNRAWHYVRLLGSSTGPSRLRMCRWRCLEISQPLRLLCPAQAGIAAPFL